MTKDVIVSVRGLQIVSGEEESGEPLELVTVGEYYFRNGSHYIFYDESYEGFSEVTKNVIKIKNGVLEVRKKGVVNVDMIFEPDKKNISFYTTPFGRMEMGIATTDIDLQLYPERIVANIEYALELNQGYVADCELNLDVRSRSGGEFSLRS